MWPKFNRHKRRISKHGHGAAPAFGTLTPLGELLDDAAPWLPVHERMFSDSTEAWLRQQAELDEATAADYETQGNALLDQAAILRRRVAEVRAYLNQAPANSAPTETAGTRQGVMPNPAAEVKHWVDGAWQPACGELSGVVAENRDAVTCAGCNYQLGNPSPSARLVDTAELARHRGQQQADATGAWQPPAAAQIPPFPQVDLTGVLAAAKHDAERLATVTETWHGPVDGEDAPLHGGRRWTPDAEETAYVHALTAVDGVA